ncbi:MAG: hypothetical protein WBX00_26665 [Isosphaeraceae bacterium]
MKLEGRERLVLKSLADLQGLSTGYVDDARLAVATKMLVEDVRDWLETLEGKAFQVLTRPPSARTDESRADAPSRTGDGERGERKGHH